MRHVATVICVCCGVVATTGLPRSCPAGTREAVEVVCGDEPEARALYERMIRSIRGATTLSYESVYRTGPEEHDLNHGAYKVWLRKPGHFRVETRVGDDDSRRGVIVGDGRYAWSYWPTGRPYFSGEDEARYAQTRFHAYMREDAPPGKYAIRYSIVMKKSNFFPVLDPSRFFGVECSLEPFIDWIREIGVEKVEEEDCRVIEVSYLDHGRSGYFWISQRDNLPRRLRRVLRNTGTGESFDEEQWSNVTLNTEIPAERFTWEPPEGWRPWRPPVPEDRLLKPGRMAPDFEFNSLDGRQVILSELRGKIVWLTIWRVQCPPCRDEIPYLERLSREHAGQGLQVLGFNFTDEVKSAAEFLHEHSVTFPCIVDTSDDAVKTAFFTYGARAAPVNYIIDRDGRIAAAWLGFDKGDAHGPETLAALGLNVSP